MLAPPRAPIENLVERLQRLRQNLEDQAQYLAALRADVAELKGAPAAEGLRVAGTGPSGGRVSLAQSHGATLPRQAGHGTGAAALITAAGGLAAGNSQPATRRERVQTAVRWSRRGLPVVLLLATMSALVLGAWQGDTAVKDRQALIVTAEQPTLVRLQGEVRLHRLPNRGWVAVEDAAPIQADDRLRTDREGRAAITWPSGAVVSLYPHSEVGLVASPPGAAAGVMLDRGWVWLDGGPQPEALPVVALTPDGVGVTGRRFQARRDGSGRLVVATADAPVEIWTAGEHQQVPPGSTTEVAPGRRASVIQPLRVGPALAVAVDGASEWLLVDRWGRAVGAPPNGGPWLDQLPAVRGPLPGADGAGVVVPNPQGDYQLVLWPSEATQSYSVAAWLTDGEAAFGGLFPAAGAGAAGVFGTLEPGWIVAVSLSVLDGQIVVAGPPNQLKAAPAVVRIAAAPATGAD